jgi:hypothetical protein
MHPVEASNSKVSAKIPHLIFLTGLGTGITSFLYYYAHGLTVAHYDAKAHLLVARRLVDSLEPGYAQMGAHWLPLTHLIYMPFVIFDSQYRTGFLPSLISVFAFAISGWLAYRISFRYTGSTAAGVFAALVLFANPNLQYLQSCPLTEPLYMMFFLLAVDRLVLWRESGHRRMPWMAAIWISLGGLCRYEGWFFLAGVMLLLLHDFWTNYVPRPRAVRAGLLIFVMFALPAAAHFGYIFHRLGTVFFNKVAAGTPGPYLTHKRPFLSLVYHLGELTQMAAILPLLLALIGFLLLLFQRERFRFRAPLLLLWIPSLINISALYWGLIYRLRYSVLLLPAVAIFGSLVLASGGVKKRALLALAIAAMALPFLPWFFDPSNATLRLPPGPGVLVLPAAALVFFMIAEVRPWHEWALLAMCILGMQMPALAMERRPIMAESLEHAFIEPQRRKVVQYLQRNYDGSRILIDMSKLAPLVYDSELAVREFVYNEGGERLWHKAFQNPETQVGWLCATKGDTVWRQLQVHPEWAGAYAPVVKTESLLLYRIKH